MLATLEKVLLHFGLELFLLTILTNELNAYYESSF